MDEKVREFVVKFFENIKATVEFQGDDIIITHVPESFEKFYGKKSPYFFTFEEEKHGFDLITTSSFLLRQINDFLENAGQTTIVKITFNFDPKKKVFEHEPLMNARLSHVNRSSNEHFIVRFTFLSTLQYLNNRDQVTNHIYIKDGKVIAFNLDEFQTEDGKKKEIDKEYVQHGYTLAKEKLKEIIKPTVETIGERLKGKLEDEIQRIKGHYATNLNEAEEKLQKLREKIQEEIDPEQKEKLKKEIEKTEKELWEETEKNDESFFIKDEIQKHTLNLKNKLINTTIIYYPVYILSAYLDVAGKKRIIYRGYDPVEDELERLRCDCCKEEVPEIIICSSGHLICRTCGNRCEKCGEIICKNCVEKMCKTCHKTICSNCEVQCKRCLKYVCTVHNLVNPQTGESVCFDCMGRCSKCGDLTDPQFLNRNLERGQAMCPKCAKDTMKRGIFR